MFVFILSLMGSAAVGLPLALMQLLLCYCEGPTKAPVLCHPDDISLFGYGGIAVAQVLDQQLRIVNVGIVLVLLLWLGVTLVSAYKKGWRAW